MLNIGLYYYQYSILYVMSTRICLMLVSKRLVFIEPFFEQIDEVLLVRYELKENSFEYVYCNATVV